MEIVPAIDLRQGACVQLEGGDVAKERVRIEDPVEQARRFIAEGARWIHIVDLDRALGTGNNFQIIRRILEVPGARYQVGGGVRFTEDIDALLDAGAARVVVGTRAVTDDKWFRHVCERYRNRIVVAIDARGTEILVKGWKEKSGRDLLEFAAEADKLGVGGFLYTDVSREGLMEGVNVGCVQQLTDLVLAPVVASGGVRDLEDCKALAGAGAWGVVIGMAAYTGKFDLKAAYAHFRGGT